jgi:hypothetical protein
MVIEIVLAQVPGKWNRPAAFLCAHSHLSTLFLSLPPSLPIGAAPGASSPAGVLCCVCDGPSPFNPYLSFL